MRFLTEKLPKLLPETVLHLLVLAPIVAWPTGLKYPTVLPRLAWTLLFMAVSIVVFFIFSKKINIKTNKLDWALTALVLVLVVRSIFSQDPQTAFWSEVERGMGIVWMVYLLAVYWVWRLSVWEEGVWRRLSLNITVATLLVAGIAVLQKTVPGFWLVGDGKRATSLFGNAMLLANYLFLASVFLLLFLFQGSAVAGFKKSKRFFYLLVVTLLLALLAIVFTETRAAQLGILIGILVGGASYIFLLPSTKMTKVVRAAATLGFVLIMFYGVVFLLARVTQNQSLLAVTFGQSYGSEPNSLLTRFENWKIAVQGIRDQPLLGYGWENYRSVVDNYYNPTIAKIGGLAEARIDKPHNLLLEITLAGGLIALAIYLAVWITFLFLVWRGYKNNQLSLKEASILTGGVFGFQTMQLFGFDSPATLLMQIVLFWFVSQRVTIASEPKLLAGGWRVSGAIVGLVVGVPIFVYGAYAPFQQGRYINEMIAANLLGNTEQVDTVFRLSRAASPGPYFFETWRESADALLLDFVSGKKPIDSLPAELRARILEDRATLLNETQNFVNSKKSSSLWQQMGGRVAWYVAKSGGGEVALTLAKESLQQALVLSPKNQESRLLLAFVFLEQKQYDTAVDNFLLTIQDSVYPDAFGSAEQMAAQLNKEQRGAVVVRLYEGYAARQPNANVYARLAAAYADQKEYDKARAAVDQAVLFDQSFQVEAAKFLQNLKP